MLYYGVDYIFTESLSELILIYVNITNVVGIGFSKLLITIATILPHVVKSLIGYCHFYYQLGYGLVFYIYVYRRYKAKKTKNWQSFYGRSVLNWIIFNFLLFNKLIVNRNFLIFLKTLCLRPIILIPIIITYADNLNLRLARFFKLLKVVVFSTSNYTWTPLFKRSSYITFLTALKRFTKRK